MDFEIFRVQKQKGYLNIPEIIEDDASLYMIVGQRSNGKTYGVIHEALQYYFEKGIASAYIRRYKESLTKSNLDELVSPHVEYIVKKSKGKYNTYTYRAGKFFLSLYDPDTGKTVQTDKNPFLYSVSLNTWETSKGADKGHLAFCVFDEFISASGYLTNEYIIFNNVLSSLIRDRTDTKIILLGNPISQVCPYFDEYGIEIEKFSPGDIVKFKYPSGAKLKFVFCPPIGEKYRKKQGIFEIGRDVASITSGYWDIGNYPHLQQGIYKESEKIAQFYIVFRHQNIAGEILVYNNIVYTFYYPAKSIPYDAEMIFSDVDIMADNVLLSFTKNNITQLIHECFVTHRSYYSSNKIGDIIKNWKLEFVNKRGII